MHYKKKTENGLFLLKVTFGGKTFREDGYAAGNKPISDMCHILFDTGRDCGGNLKKKKCKIFKLAVFLIDGLVDSLILTFFLKTCSFSLMRTFFLELFFFHKFPPLAEELENVVIESAELPYEH